MKNEIMLKFSKIITELRRQNNYTLKYVASVLEITYQSYQSYELGKSFPSIEKFVKLAELYDVSLDELIGRENYSL